MLSTWDCRLTLQFGCRQYLLKGKKELNLINSYFFSACVNLFCVHIKFSHGPAWSKPVELRISDNLEFIFITFWSVFMFILFVNQFWIGIISNYPKYISSEKHFYRTFEKSALQSWKRIVLIYSLRLGSLITELEASKISSYLSTVTGINSWWTLFPETSFPKHAI